MANVNRKGEKVKGGVDRDVAVDLVATLEEIAGRLHRNKAAKGDDHDESRRRIAMIEIDPDAVKRKP